MVICTVTLLLSDIRSCHNVGAILRTAEAAGAHEVVFCGITPHPNLPDDPRAPHIIARNTRAIAKTALGSEQKLKLRYAPDAGAEAAALAERGFAVAALETGPGAQNLFAFPPPPQLALILGSETEGVPAPVLSAAHAVLEIPMRGTKESLNVSVAAGIALYHFLRP